MCTAITYQTKDFYFGRTLDYDASYAEEVTVTPRNFPLSFREKLTACKKEHKKLQDEINVLLDKYHDDGKNPNPIAKGMSWMKTNMKLGMEESDATIADLMTDGCNMGVKSLNRYLNQYTAADEVSKDIAKRLINLEEQLTIDIRGYL